MKQLIQNVTWSRSREEYTRVQELCIPEEFFREFFEESDRVSIEELERIPLSRYSMSIRLSDMLGKDFVEHVLSTLANREQGALTLRLPDPKTSKERCIRLLTAFAYLLGTPNSEPYSNEYYGFDRMTNEQHVPENLWGPYKTFQLHSAGSPLAESCDWFMETRFSEKHAQGGSRRILHVDDWEDFEVFSNHPLAREPLMFKMPVGKDAVRSLLHPSVRGIEKTVFFGSPEKPYFRFIDCFLFPESLEHARYLAEICQSLKETERAVSIPLPPISIMILNNHFWVHGREPYVEHPLFEREILLAHGCAYKNSPLSA